MFEGYARFRYDNRLQGEAFDNVEEALLWSLRCQIAKEEGARIVAGAGVVPRLCDPDDIARILGGLCRKKILNFHHMGVLQRYGRRKAMGMLTSVYQPRAEHLWQQILSSLSLELRTKGVIL